MRLDSSQSILFAIIGVTFPDGWGETGYSFRMELFSLLSLFEKSPAEVILTDRGSSLLLVQCTLGLVAFFLLDFNAERLS